MCGFVFLLLQVSQTMCKCISWVIFLVATSAVLWCSDWCLRSCGLPQSNVVGLTPDDPAGLVPFSSRCGICVAMIFWREIEKEDDNEEKWDGLKNIYFATC